MSVERSRLPEHSLRHVKHHTRPVTARIRRYAQHSCQAEKKHGVEICRPSRLERVKQRDAFSHIPPDRSVSRTVAKHYLQHFRQKQRYGSFHRAAAYAVERHERARLHEGVHLASRLDISLTLHKRQRHQQRPGPRRAPSAARVDRKRHPASFKSVGRQYVMALIVAHRAQHYQVKRLLHPAESRFCRFQNL